MLRGFIHEISNTLTSNMLALATVIKEEHTLCEQNAQDLHDLFDLIAPELSAGTREIVIEHLQQIEQHEEQLDHVLRVVNDAIDRAIDRTKLVSAYAKLEYHPVNLQPTFLHTLIDTLLLRYQPQFHEQRILACRHGEVATPLLMHPPHASAILEPLIQNACQALADIPDGRERRIDITLRETLTHQQVMICDTANGIPEDRLSDIFEPFYTTHSKTQAGLGLNFVAKLTAMYAGTVNVESIFGQGTCVTLTFPLNPPGGSVHSFDLDA